MQLGAGEGARHKWAPVSFMFYLKQHFMFVLCFVAQYTQNSLSSKGYSVPHSPLSERGIASLMRGIGGGGLGGGGRKKVIAAAAAVAGRD